MSGYVAVVGLGYVGLPLAVSFAAAGQAVIGVDTSPAVRRAVREFRAPFFESGLDAALAALPEGLLAVADALPEEPPDAVVICVGTPVDRATGEPDLTNLAAAVDTVAPRIGAQTLVVVRSTVPVGTCRGVVLPRLLERHPQPHLAFAPERMIQGRALAEMSSLPQIIGGLDERSVLRAAELHAVLGSDPVTVSSLEAAEMIKLICNAHTDLIYGFGNEVALMASALGLDAEELIRSANLRYPRPDLSRPGYVGGSCLTKDPYLLMHSAASAGYRPPMVEAARRVNESVPNLLARSLLDELARTGVAPSRAKVLVCGIAYKGRPETDDVRGSAAGPVAELLGGAVATLAGHDFRVPPEQIKALGFEPMALDDGLAGADAVLLLTDHEDYGKLTADFLRPLLRGPRLVLDTWGLLDTTLSNEPELRYLRFGRG